MTTPAFSQEQLDQIEAEAKRLYRQKVTGMFYKELQDSRATSLENVKAQQERETQERQQQLQDIEQRAYESTMARKRGEMRARREASVLLRADLEHLRKDLQAQRKERELIRREERLMMDEITHLERIQKRERAALKLARNQIGRVLRDPEKLPYTASDIALF